MPIVGKLLRRFRAGAHRSPLTAPEYAGADTIDITSSAFDDGGAIPQKYAGSAVGDNVSPPLRWSGVPAPTKQLALVIDDIDVPGPKPLMHTIALIDADRRSLDEGELKPGAAGVRFVKAFGDSYVGPAPIRGHGPHHYRFQLFALDQPVPDDVTDHKGFLAAIAGHVLARGALTGTYER